MPHIWPATRPTYCLPTPRSRPPTPTPRRRACESIEDYGLALARHFVHDVGPVEAARIEIEEYAWQRATVDGVGHDYTWIRKGQEVRTAAVTVDAQGEWVVAGLKDFIILKSTGSEFAAS